MHQQKSFTLNFLSMKYFLSKNFELRYIHTYMVGTIRETLKDLKQLTWKVNNLFIKVNNYAD